MQLEHSFTVPVGVEEAFRVLRDIERIGPCMPGATITSVEGEEFAGKVKVKVGPMQVTYQGTAQFVEVDEARHSAKIEAKGKEARGPGTANATITATCTESDGVTTVDVVTDLAITGKPAQFGRGVMADVGDKLLGKFADCLAEELSGEHEDVLEDQAPDAAAEAAGEPGPADGEQTDGEQADGEQDAVGAAAGSAASAAAGSAAGAATGGQVSAAEAGDAPTGQPAVAAAATPPSRPAVQRRTDDTIDLLDVAGAPVMKRLAPLIGGLLLLWFLLRTIRRRR
jgi:uncharacterized protein